MADHLEVNALFERYERLVTEGAVGEARRALAETICMALTVHITAEEELFYPAARRADRRPSASRPSPASMSTYVSGSGMAAGPNVMNVGLCPL